MVTSSETQTTQATTWKVDPAHSLVEFSTKHMMFTTVKGRFTSVRGTIVDDPADPTRSSVEAEIDVASIDTREEQRDNHLRSADFFHAEQHPLLTFKSTRVEPVGENHFKVIGDLTIRGASREVTLDTTFNGRGTNPFGAEVAGYTAETTINRKDFGLNWNVALEAGGFLVSDTIKILLEIQAVKQA
jgi:polyisoprenoid-binding protein YceI